jgi:predicted MFS family arabinose efflux permease
VALPLQAVAVGYSAVEIGVLIAVSAISQMTSRMFLGKVMRHIPDWVIIATACALLAASCLLVVASGHVAAFLMAQLLQGVARACFWTGSQTHVVRGDVSAVRALASVNLIGNLGLLSGPVLAGVLIGEDARAALVVSALAALVAMLPTLRLERLPPFKKLSDRQPGRIWQRHGVWEGCYAGVTAGAWRGLLGSYVPLVLVHEQHSSMTVGILVAVANASSILGALAVARINNQQRVLAVLFLATPVTGVAVAATGLLAWSAPLAGLALTVSGIAAGALQTLGPAIASDAVHQEERGEAIAATGTWRAASLFVAPLATAGMVAVVPIGAAMVATGVLMALPAGRWMRRPTGRGGATGRAVPGPSAASARRLSRRRPDPDPARERRCGPGGQS